MWQKLHPINPFVIQQALSYAFPGKEVLLPSPGDPDFTWNYHILEPAAQGQGLVSGCRLLIPKTLTSADMTALLDMLTQAVKDSYQSVLFSTIYSASPGSTIELKKLTPGGWKTIWST